ncbi:hypothetical protein COLO4_22096 [Corchorus olitorius]|uniref:non-specific serine/threonine protein kinase n=1 Tax=Corchorus olitorius TaxID=93759 RepID=A0A1R3IP57_9ROSI|nr:hypothetical protein COLO4_22096 [Corchorus olitorius]
MAPSPEESPNQDSPPPPPPSDSSDDSSPPPSSPSPPPPKSSSSPPAPPSSDNNDSPSRPSPPAPKGGGGKDDSPSTPAPKSGGGNKHHSHNKDSGRPDVKVIVGVAVAAGILLLIMIILLSRCLSKRKKRRNQQMQYYPSHQPNKGGSDQYYNASQSPPPWHNSPQGGEHIVKVPPPPPGGGSWGAAPPMQSQPHYSGGDSSSNFSGPFRPPPLPPPSPGISLGFNKSTFTYEELAAATNGFSQVNLLGQGGFGYVHKGKNLPVMDFPTRLRIALGSAKGLAYLHEDCHPRIIHRDIKAANILLDFNFEAMVADFGLAKLSSDNYTHVSTRVMGTFGYLAPEYASSGKLTEKSDVFSFGVMLLELITGHRPVDPTSAMEDSLVDWARPLLARALEDGNVDQLADARLEGNFRHNEMQRMVACAAASIRHSARKRPKMSQIVRALEGDSSLDDLNEGVKPGQSHIYNNSGMMSSDYSASNYQADMARFRQLALSSQEFPSNEFGGTGTSTSSGDHSSEMPTPPGMQKHNI